MWGLGGFRHWHPALMLVIFHLALLFLLSCPICKVVILIICCWKQTISKQWLQTITIIYLLMNLKFGPGLARQFTFIPRGISWGGLKDNWGQVQWGSSETKSLGVNAEDLVVLPHAFLPPSSPPCFQTPPVLSSMCFPDLAILNHLQVSVKNAFPSLSLTNSCAASKTQSRGHLHLEAFLMSPTPTYFSLH